MFIYSIVTLHIFFIVFLQLSTGCYRLEMFDFATLELFCQLVLNFQHSFDVCLSLLESMCQEILTFWQRIPLIRVSTNMEFKAQMRVYRSFLQTFHASWHPKFKRGALTPLTLNKLFSRAKLQLYCIYASCICNFTYLE